MSLTLLLPGLAAMLLGTLSGLIRWPLRPRTALVTLSLVLLGTAAATSMLIGALAIGFLVEQPLFETLVKWCPRLTTHHGVSPVVGVPSLLIASSMGLRIRSVVASHRRSARSHSQRFVMIDSDEPVAYAVGGKPGCIVVSSGMMTVLTWREQDALFAHERAHLDGSHHRFVLLAGLSEAAVPVLRPLASQVRLATERVADEAAADALGGDRRAVARAIARAAVARSNFATGATNFTGGSVSRRVAALVGEPVRTPVASVATAVTAIAVAAAWLGSTVQLHHLVEVSAHMCGH